MSRKKNKRVQHVIAQVTRRSVKYAPRFSVFWLWRERGCLLTTTCGKKTTQRSLHSPRLTVADVLKFVFEKRWLPPAGSPPWLPRSVELHAPCFTIHGFLTNCRGLKPWNAGRVFALVLTVMYLDRDYVSLAMACKVRPVLHWPLCLHDRTFYFSN